MKRESLTTTKTHRPGGQRLWRGLAFEQMESRLALSTTTGIDAPGIELQLDRNALLAAYQGGFVDLELRSFANQVRYHVAGLQSESTNSFDADGINLRDWIQFEGTLGAYDSNEFTTIPQPAVGPTQPHGGMIAIGEIFAVAPLVKMGNNAEAIAQEVRGQLESSEVVSIDERFSLSRARDVYFEVAVRVDHGDLESQDHLGSSDTSVAVEKLAADGEASEEAESKSIAALAARGRSLPSAQSDSPMNRSDVVRDQELAQPLREAPSVSQSPDTISKPEKVAQPKQVSQHEVRDQVFQAWRDSKLDVTRRVPGRPAEEEQDDTANWPVLAALAVGGLVFSSRRLSKAAPSQLQPPRQRPGL